MLRQHSFRRLTSDFVRNAKQHPTAQAVIGLVLNPLVHHSCPIWPVRTCSTDQSGDFSALPKLLRNYYLSTTQSSCISAALFSSYRNQGSFISHSLARKDMHSCLSLNNEAFTFYQPESPFRQIISLAALDITIISNLLSTIG